jgi:thymidine phosphorylase
MWLHRNKGAKVLEGEKIFTVYSNNKDLLKYACEYYNKNKILIS